MLPVCGIFVLDVQGPPSSAPASYPNVCGNGWTCEHRWTSILNMAKVTNRYRKTHMFTLFLPVCQCSSRSINHQLAGGSKIPAFESSNFTRPPDPASALVAAVSASWLLVTWGRSSKQDCWWILILCSSFVHVLTGWCLLRHHPRLRAEDHYH